LTWKTEAVATFAKAASASIISLIFMYLSVMLVGFG
jgi:hypothetical protein